MSTITLEIIKTFLGLSVFKRPKISIYFGSIELGAPFFFPRKSNKDRKFVPIKWFGVNIVELGWKTKWHEHDVRFEWSPQFHLIILKRQLVISLEHEYFDYWEALILYTLLKGTKEERLSMLLDKKSFRYQIRDGYTKDIKNLIFRDRYNEDYR